jgi:hypothetical protein
MLSVNPKNRPSISFILERPFIKKRVASYIFDFIESYTIDPISDKEDHHIEILKEQAEKLGILNQLLLKEVNPYEDNNNNEKAIKQYNESNKDKDQPFVSCNSYLDKSNEQKKKIEEKILELEKQKKQIYANIRGRDIKKNSEIESSTEKKNYYEKLKLISSSVERKKAIGKIDREKNKRVQKQDIINESDEFIKISSNIGIKDSFVGKSKRPDSNKKPNKIPSIEKKEDDNNNNNNNNDISLRNSGNVQQKNKLQEKNLKSKINIESNLNSNNNLNNNNNQNIKKHEINSSKEKDVLKRPNSGIQKENFSKKDININTTNKKSTNNINNINNNNNNNFNNNNSKNININKSSINNNNNQYINSNSNSNSNSNNQNNLIALNNSRDSYYQISMIKNDQSFDENILETIREEVESGKLKEDKNKIETLTNEIVRMKKYLDLMQNKINKIENKIEDDDINKEKNQGEIDYNDTYLNSQEANFDVNTYENDKFQYNSNDIDQVNTDESDLDEIENDENLIEKEKIEDDGSNKIMERIKFQRQ